jgi:predicted nuclease of restriction endonuclease-like RecB superfamily
VVLVRKNRDGTYTADLAQDATDEQRAQAAQIVAAFDSTKAEHNAGIDAQITALEANSGGYVRGLREFMLAASLVMKQQGGPDFMLNKGMQNVKALDDQIKALRAQRQ